MKKFKSKWLIPLLIFSTAVLLAVTGNYIKSNIGLEPKVVNDTTKVLFFDGSEHLMIPVLEEIRIEAESKGVMDFPDRVKKAIDTVQIKDLGLYTLGTFNSKYRTLTLNVRLLTTPGWKGQTPLVIYHEVGHALAPDKDHSCGNCYDIMSANSNPAVLVSRSTASWRILLDKYFKFTGLDK
jgi:hypothetical protein